MYKKKLTFSHVLNKYGLHFCSVFGIFCVCNTFHCSNMNIVCMDTKSCDFDFR